MGSIKIKNRAIDRILKTDGLSFHVESYSMMEIGGPDKASVIAYGVSREDLWELIEMLRCPVEIIDDDEDVVWWGYISGVQIFDGKIADSVSLDGMYNRVAVAYSLSTPGVSGVGERLTTDWAEDVTSVVEFGTRENLLTKPSSTAIEADNMRDYQLAQTKYPIPVTTISSDAVNPPYARIQCSGWWYTLGWTYYLRSAGIEQNTSGSGQLNLGGVTETIVGTGNPTYNAIQAFGDATATSKVITTLQLSGAMTITDFVVPIYKVGAPADNLLIKLYSDSAGSPGSLLATGTLPGTGLATTVEWTTEPLDTPQALSGSTAYHMELSRDGAIDAVNYYVVEVDTGLSYTSGQLKIWNGSAWVARSPNADLAFYLMGDGTYTKFEQSFQLTGGEAWKASNIQISAFKIGSPVDNLQVRLYTDSSGSPGSLLATATMTGSSVPTSSAWLTMDLDVEIDLSLATTYHIQVDRTGSVDALNYYVIGLDTGLNYTSGIGRAWNGSGWVRNEPDADLLFVIGGVEETTTQLETAMTGSEFITSVDLKVDSGIFTNQYRDGDERLIDVINDLLRSGISGGTRLLATVTVDLELVVYAEPDRSDYEFLIDRSGVLKTTVGGPIDPQKCPVGVWVRRTDVPSEANTERLIDLSRLFISYGEFSTSSGYVPTPRGASRPFELPGQINI